MTSRGSCRSGSATPPRLAVGGTRGMLAAWWSRVIATSALGRWRERADAGHFVRPHEQNGAGRVVHDKARRRAQAVRSQAGAVAVTGRHQQVSRLCGSHDLPLDASSADHLDDPGSSEQPGGSREESFPRSRRFGRHLLGQAGPGSPPSHQPLRRSAGCVGHVLGHDVQQRHPGVGGDERRGGHNATLPGSFGQPYDHLHDGIIPPLGATAIERPSKPGAQAAR